MPENKPMTRLELIRIIGNTITKVDELRVNYDRDNITRKKLDNNRDELDTYQRKLVRNVIDDNTDEFKGLTLSLKEVNKELLQANRSVEKISQILEKLVEFVKVVQKIAELIS